MKKGLKVSAETREKMSLSRKRWWVLRRKKKPEHRHDLSHLDLYRVAAELESAAIQLRQSGLPAYVMFADFLMLKVVEFRREAESV